MPNQPSTATVGPDGLCSECQQRHVTRLGNPSCLGHVRFDRDSQSPTYRARLDQPRPCGRDPLTGLDRCHMHGAGSKNARAKGAQAKAETKATAAIIRKIGDSGEPVTDPISKLCAIAGRAVAFMEALGSRVDQLDGESLDRAEIAVYGRSIKDAAGVVESIIRMGIAERLAKVEEEQTAAIVKFIDGVLTDLGHNPRAPEVAGVVARRLELVS